VPETLYISVTNLRASCQTSNFSKTIFVIHV
jgi:hypothetical protein